MNPDENNDTNGLSGGIKPWDGRGGKIYEVPGQNRISMVIIITHTITHYLTYYIADIHAK